MVPRAAGRDGPMLDCLIVGGGPAGLTASIYAARFSLKVQVVDAGASRAALIPCTHNHAGFPDGISGRELIARMRRQAVKSGARVEFGQVKRIKPRDHAFVAETSTGLFHARTVLLATGVTNRCPTMGQGVHSAALAAGRLRYCPVCDGFEVTDQDVAVIGTAAPGVKEALFLRAYSERVTLVSPDSRHVLTAKQRETLANAEIALMQGPVSDFRLEPTGLSFSTPLGRRRFEAVYPAMGSVAHSDLATALGAKVTSAGCITVDAHQRTSLPGLYAAGDVVIGLDQISHAMGEAGVAATTIRNDLAELSPFLR
jgi:thioredoxin reductase (NADPH)